MSEDVTLPNSAGIVDTFQRARASDGQTVNMQAVVPVDPVTGDALSLAQQSTLLALNSIAAAIQSAVDSLNAKTTAVNTGAISGTVALDSASLAALETISVANFPGTQPVSGTVTANTGLSQPLTDAQLRAAAVPVSGNVGITGSVEITNDVGNAIPVTSSNANPVVIQGVQDTATTGSITSAASVVGPLSVVQRNVITISIRGTYAGVTFIIEASDDGGTSWFPLQCIDNATGQAGSTWTPGANSSASYDSAVGGYTHIRVRATAWTSGTANVQLTGQSFAYDPVVAAISQPLDVDLTAASVGAANGDLFSVDARGIAAILLQITGTFSATVTFQGSDDGTTWSTVNAINASTGVVATTSTAVGLFAIPVRTRYVRARVTAWTSGSVTGVYRMRSASLDPVGTTQVVSGTVTANIGTGSLAAGTNAVGDVGVQYRANATGAASVASALSPATPAVGTIKASAGRLIGWQLQNSSTGVRSVKIFNATAPTLGTTAAIFEIDIPAGGRAELQLPGGIGFATAITWSATSAKGLTDNTATGLAANDVSGAFFYA